MKTFARHYLLLALLSSLPLQSQALPLGTAFSYQGRLSDGTTPANGSYDLLFTLYDDATNVLSIAAAVTNAATAVSNGLFTVTLDFGPGAFTGEARWLEIAVRTNGGTSFRTLTPRQPINPAPYALYALTPAGPPGPPGPSIVTGNSPTAIIAATNTGTGPGIVGNASDTSVLGVSTSGAYGYLGGNGTGVYGSHPSGNFAAIGGANSGVYGYGVGVPGVWGTNANGHGLRGDSGANIAVLGIHGGASSDVGGSGGVYGLSSAGFGVGGESRTGDGVIGASQSGYAGHFYGTVKATGVVSSDSGVYGTNNSGHGIRGDSGGNIAVLGINGGASSDVGGSGGVYGLSSSGFGVGGESRTGDGVIGSSQSGYAGHFYGTVRATGMVSSDSGVYGTNYNGHGIRGDSGGNIAVLGINGGASSDVGGNGGVYGLSGTGFGVGGESRTGDGVIGSSQSGYAGHFYGPVRATGVVSSDSGLRASATRTGDWNASVGYVENLNSGANTSPALRVVANGNTPYGALSVSVQGTGLIASFGNASTWVARLDASGNWYATSFNPSSDRDIKENFETVSPRAVLDKVTALPIAQWNFKADAGTKHLGPMAQDFYSAFGIGSDDKHIATVDADGVALAAIQGLNQKLEEKNARLERELADLKAVVTSLAEKVANSAR